VGTLMRWVSTVSKEMPPHFAQEPELAAARVGLTVRHVEQSQLRLRMRSSGRTISSGGLRRSITSRSVFHVARCIETNAWRYQPSHQLGRRGDCEAGEPPKGRGRLCGQAAVAAGNCCTPPSNRGRRSRRDFQNRVAFTPPTLSHSWPWFAKSADTRRNLRLALDCMEGGRIGCAIVRV